MGGEGGETGNTQHTVVLVLLALDLGSSIKEIVIYRGSKMHVQKTAENMRQHN